MKDRFETSSVIHIHFGMSGQFRFIDYPADPREDHIKPTVRLELLFPDLQLALHLSCQKLVLGNTEYYMKCVNDLGPDPLREDADKNQFFDNCSTFKKTVGELLMDQTRIAGVGNIYRAEILFKSKIHPKTKCADLDRGHFDLIWKHTTECLKRGVETGSIITVDEEDAVKLGPPWTRRYIYDQSKCGVCASTVKSFQMGGRNCFCCEICQNYYKPSMESALPEQASISSNYQTLTVPQLKRTLQTLGLSIKGTKSMLIKSLEDFYNPEKLSQTPTRNALNSIPATPEYTNPGNHALRTPSHNRTKELPNDPLKTPPSTPLSAYSIVELKKRLKEHKLPTSGTKKQLIKALESVLNDLNDDSDPESPCPQPQTKNQMASILDERTEKRRAGEKLNIEHVALVADEIVLEKVERLTKKMRK